MAVIEMGNNRASTKIAAGRVDKKGRYEEC